MLAYILADLESLRGNKGHLALYRQSRPASALVDRFAEGEFAVRGTLIQEALNRMRERHVSVIRRDFPGSYCHLTLLTGNSEKEQVVEELAAGADDYPKEALSFR